MNIFRLTSSLLNDARQDLRRPHPIAFERMGFFFCRAAALSEGSLILAEAYEPISDENYIVDRSVGARMDGNAIRAAMQRALSTNCGIFHVHLHDWCGIPTPSQTDQREANRFVPDFFNASPTMPHGTIILSDDSLAGWMRTAKLSKPEKFGQIEIVGVPLRLVDVRA